MPKRKKRRQPSNTTSEIFKDLWDREPFTRSRCVFLTMSGYAPKFRQDGDDVLQIYAKTEKPVGSSSIYFDQSCRKPNRGRRNVWRAELCFNGLRIRKRSYSKVDLEEWIEKTRHHWLENFVSGAQKPTLLTLRNRFLTLKEKLARNAGGNTAEKL